MSFQSTIYYLREYFFPSGCGGCGKALGHADARYGLCEKCRTAFGVALVFGRRCRYCGKPLITEKDVCLSCRDNTACDSYDGHIKRLRVLFPYVGKFKSVLASYKFERAAALGIFFARCLTLSLEAFGKQALDLRSLEKAAWVPVPPSREKSGCRAGIRSSTLRGCWTRQMAKPAACT